MSDVLVLCYHAVSEDWPAPLSVTPDALERQLSLLARHGFRGVTLTSALADPPAERVVAVTFDDAYRSVRELAWPILNRLGMVGSVYVPTDWPGQTNYAGNQGTAFLCDLCEAQPSTLDPALRPNGVFYFMSKVKLADFKGFVGLANVGGIGVGTEANGRRRDLFFDADVRFMKGTYVGVDHRRHEGTFAFV